MIKMLVLDIDGTIIKKDFSYSNELKQKLNELQDKGVKVVIATGRMHMGAVPLAKELGPSGIRVNCVAPGVIDTDMNKCLDDEIRKELSDSTALCRIGEARDVAEAVLFLASDSASFITGQTLTIDGGFI